MPIFRIEISVAVCSVAFGTWCACYRIWHSVTCRSNFSHRRYHSLPTTTKTRIKTIRIHFKDCKALVLSGIGGKEQAFLGRKRQPMPLSFVTILLWDIQNYSKTLHKYHGIQWAFGKQSPFYFIWYSFHVSDLLPIPVLSSFNHSLSCLNLCTSVPVFVCLYLCLARSRSVSVSVWLGFYLTLSFSDFISVWFHLCMTRSPSVFDYTNLCLRVISLHLFLPNRVSFVQPASLPFFSSFSPFLQSILVSLNVIQNKKKTQKTNQTTISSKNCMQFSFVIQQNGPLNNDGNATIFSCDRFHFNVIKYDVI